MLVRDLIKDLETYSPDAEVTSATIRVRQNKLRSTLMFRKPRKSAQG